MSQQSAIGAHCASQPTMRVTVVYFRPLTLHREIQAFVHEMGQSGPSQYIPVWGQRPGSQVKFLPEE